MLPELWAPSVNPIAGIAKIDVNFYELDQFADSLCLSIPCTSLLRTRAAVKSGETCLAVLLVLASLLLALLPPSLLPC